MCNPNPKQMKYLYGEVTTPKKVVYLPHCPTLTDHRHPSLLEDATALTVQALPHLNNK